MTKSNFKFVFFLLAALITPFAILFAFGWNITEIVVLMVVLFPGWIIGLLTAVCIDIYTRYEQKLMSNYTFRSRSHVGESSND
jgi:high-affinity K+ transport system ATPase subunit B